MTTEKEDGPFNKPPSKKAKVQASILAHFSKTTPPKTLNSSKEEVPIEDDKEQVLPAASKAVSKLTAEQQSLCELERKHLPQAWFQLLESEFAKPYFAKLKQFLATEKASGATIFPPEHLIYSWAKLCPFEKTRVIIIGQDPYHNDGQAMGLAFSVPKGVAIPPSLVNIYLELSNDFKGSFTPPAHGCLEGWAQQGMPIREEGKKRE